MPTDFSSLELRPSNRHTELSQFHPSYKRFSAHPIQPLKAMPDYIQVPEQFSIWLNPLQCNPPPRYLWRINDKYSKAQRNDDGDLQTAYHEISSSWHGIRNAILNHLDWNSKGLSCFMSLTSNKEHARELAMKRAGYIQDPFQYSDNSDDLVRYEIDTDYLHAHIYKAIDLVYVFHIPVAFHRDISTEFLILKQIPEEAIVDTSTIKDMRMESGKFFALLPGIKKKKRQSKHILISKTVLKEDEDELKEGEELKMTITRDNRQGRSWRSRFAYRNGKDIEQTEELMSKEAMTNS